eukprot:4499949-Alexandrium_andersonii.AAC.1
MSHALGSESSGELRGAPRSSGELQEAPESLGLVHLLSFLFLKGGWHARSHSIKSAKSPQAFEA